MILTLTLVSIVSLGLAVGLFAWSLNRGRYRRHPYEIYLLVGGSAACGVVAAWWSRAWLLGGLALIELGAVGVTIWYYSMGARFPRSEVPLDVGDPFPEFSLPDSTGTVFDSRNLTGDAASLFLFYRGNW